MVGTAWTNLICGNASFDCMLVYDTVYISTRRWSLPLTDMLITDKTLKVNVFSVSNKSTCGLIGSGCTSIEDVVRQESGIEKLNLETT